MKCTDIGHPMYWYWYISIFKTLLSAFGTIYEHNMPELWYLSHNLLDRRRIIERKKVESHPPVGKYSTTTQTIASLAKFHDRCAAMALELEVCVECFYWRRHSFQRLWSPTHRSCCSRYSHSWFIYTKLLSFDVVALKLICIDDSWIMRSPSSSLQAKSPWSSLNAFF